MTNKEAIGTIKIAINEVEWEYPMEYTVAFEMAIKALEKQSEPEWNSPDEVLPISYEALLLKVDTPFGEQVIKGHYGLDKRWYPDEPMDNGGNVIAWRYKREEKNAVE